ERGRTRASSASPTAESRPIGGRAPRATPRRPGERRCRPSGGRGTRDKSPGACTRSRRPSRDRNGCTPGARGRARARRSADTLRSRARRSAAARHVPRRAPETAASARERADRAASPPARAGRSHPPASRTSARPRSWPALTRCCPHVRAPSARLTPETRSCDLAHLRRSIGGGGRRSANSPPFPALRGAAVSLAARHGDLVLHAPVARSRTAPGAGSRGSRSTGAPQRPRGSRRLERTNLALSLTPDAPKSERQATLLPTPGARSAPSSSSTKKMGTSTLLVGQPAEDPAATLMQVAQTPELLYRVRRGDTLAKIAWGFGYRYPEIARKDRKSVG